MSKTTKTERQILGYLAGQPDSTVPAVANALGMNKNSVGARLSELLRRGLVTREWRRNGRRSVGHFSAAAPGNQTELHTILSAYIGKHSARLAELQAEVAATEESVAAAQIALEAIS